MDNIDTTTDNSVNEEQAFETELNALTNDSGPEASNNDVKPEETSKPEPKVDENNHGLTPEQKVENNANAFRRISRTNEKLRRKINQLTERIQKLEGSTRPEEILEQNRLVQEANTYQTMVDATEADEWENRAYTVFGNNAPRFIEYSQRYAEHVNRNEPELSSYIDRPYGFVVLNEWFRQMDDVNNQRQWLSMTGYEKGKILDTYYNQLVQLAKGSSNGHT